MSDDVISQVLIALARIEERIKAQAEQSEHRHNNLKMVVEGFVPRRELDERFAAMNARITKNENNISRGGWAIISAWLSGIGVVVTLALKKL